MNACTISGCRHLQTHCVGCGRLVLERILPPTLGWISMRDQQPTDEGEILLKSDLTDERIGTVWLDGKRVILRRTDLGFDDIDWWMHIPEAPE